MGRASAVAHNPMMIISVIMMISVQAASTTLHRSSEAFSYGIGSEVPNTDAAYAQGGHHAVVAARATLVRISRTSKPA